MTAGTRWSLAIVGLLTANVLAMAVLAVTALRGGSEVIPDYYETGVHYDTAIDHATVSRALGWRASAEVRDGELVVAVRDERGTAVTGAHVAVVGYQRAFSTDRVAVALTASGAVYRGAFPARPGVQDLAITVERGRDHFEQAIAVVAR